MAPEGLLWSKHKNTRYKQNLFWVAHPKRFSFWWVMFAANRSAKNKKVDRNEKKMSVLEKLRTEEKLRKKYQLQSFFYQWAAFQLCAVVTHSVSVWAGISVYYLRRYGHSARPAVSVCSLVGEVALAEWSWTSHMVLRGGRKRTLNGTKHNTYHLIPVANASVTANTLICCPQNDLALLSVSVFVSWCFLLKIEVFRKAPQDFPRWPL